MATARTKVRTLRHDIDEYEITLPELLAAAGIPPVDIVAGEFWRVTVNGDSVVLVRHHAPILNPTASASSNGSTL